MPWSDRVALPVLLVCVALLLSALWWGEWRSTPVEAPVCLPCPIDVVLEGEGRVIRIDCDGMASIHV